MDVNRNQFFMFGVLVLLVGIQLRVIESYVLTKPATEFLAKRAAKTEAEKAAISVGPQKVIRLPDWSGWALVSVGSVLVLHSLALKKPG